MMKKTVCLLFMCLLLVGILAGCDTIDEIDALGFLAGLFRTHTISVAFLSNGSTCRSIGYEAFYACSALSEFFIPQAVEYMGERAFFGCTDITVTAEHSEQPSGWHKNWAAGCNVVWGAYR